MTPLRPVLWTANFFPAFVQALKVYFYFNTLWNDLTISWNDLTISWNELTILCNELTILWNEVTWNEMTMERNDRIPIVDTTV